MKYIGKKLVTMIGTLLVVSFLVFLAFSVIPGDPALAKLGTEATPERLESLREQMGLNAPLLERYGNWILSFVKGDMGTSYSYSMPVRSMIGDKLPITITLTCMAFIFVILISLPVALFTASHAGKAPDRLVYTFNQIMMSVPPFFAGLLFTIVFGMLLKWFVPGDFVSYTSSIGGFLRYLILPALAIALPKIAMCVKLLRSSVVMELKTDYVRTALSRGNNMKSVLYQHILKNALIPVITFLGMTLADMIAGSIIIEQVFNIPGLGRILLTSISNRDYPVVEAIIVLLAFVIIVINFGVDLLYQIVDPRIRISGKEQS
ncbi:MAG: ABC transporter permease [Lachnospiraceae bacterium]|nr:ABC transporter permease [Lachnospiraceae bacterium]